MTVTLQMCIFDPPLVKPKCVSGVAEFFWNCKQTAENCKQTAENWKNPPLLKHILALPITCTFMDKSCFPSLLVNSALRY